MQTIRLYLSVFILIPLGLFGQDTTTVIKPLTRYFTDKDIQFNTPLHPIDTNSNRLEIFNPVYRTIVFSELGNIGLPSQSLIFNNDKPVGFNYSFNPYSVYFLDPQKTEYINTRTPYTDAYYSQGGGEMLFLKLKHAQNINPRWNAGVELNRITSQGYLLRQYSSYWGVNVFSSYFNKSKKYVLLANYCTNSGINDESGGVQSDSSFESLTGGLKQVYTKLANSVSHYHNRNVLVKQYFRFGSSSKIENEKDTIYDFTPKFQIAYTIQANQMSYAFYNQGDTNSVLLPSRYYDVTSQTYDSTYSGKLSNHVSFQFLGPNKSESFFLAKYDSVRYNFSIGLRHELINVAQPAFVRQFQNIILEASHDLIDTKTQTAIVHAELSYVANGYNKGDYKADVRWRLKYKYFTVAFSTVLQQIRPDYFYTKYKSNQFIWNNDFVPVNTSILLFSLSTNRLRNNFRVSFKTQQINNFVYLDTDGLPKQEISNVYGGTQINTIELSKTFQIWKFRFEHLIYYQKSSSDHIRIPELSGVIRYYFQSRFFGLSRFQIGVNTFYNTQYTGYSYNPSYHQFFLQNEVAFGNYPVINPFFVADIKRASLFFVYEHVNMDLIKHGMYTTAHYPIALATFRMGVRWRFFD